MRKSRIIPIAAATIISLAIFGGATVFAQGTTDGHINIVQRIAQRFGLQESEVQKVFDEVNEERHQQMQARLEERLNQAVTDGKITEVQKQAILKKFSEMKNNKPDFEKFKSMTEEERRAEMEKKRTEMEAWVEENGLTLETVHQLMDVGFKHGSGGKMFHIKLSQPTE